MTLSSASQPKSPPRTSPRRALATQAAAGALVTAVAWLAACGKPQPEPPPKPPPEPQTELCAAPATWFPHSQTPEPDPGQSFGSFCDFHQWAWQSFLWLTQATDGKLRFETFPTVDDVINGTDTASTRGTMRLAVRTQKVHGPSPSLDEVTQADSLGVLVDHGGRATYYAQYVNPPDCDRRFGADSLFPSAGLSAGETTGTFAWPGTFACRLFVYQNSRWVWCDAVGETTGTPAGTPADRRSARREAKAPKTDGAIVVS